MNYRKISLIVATIGVVFTIFSYIETRSSSSSVNSSTQQKNNAANGVIINQNSGNKDSFNTVYNNSFPDDLSERINRDLDNHVQKLTVISKKQDLIIQQVMSNTSLTLSEKKYIIGTNINIVDEVKNVRLEIYNDIKEHKNDSSNFVGLYNNVSSTKGALEKLLIKISENSNEINNSIIDFTSEDDLYSNEHYDLANTSNAVQKYDDPVKLFMDRGSTIKSTDSGESIVTPEESNIQNWVFVGQENEIEALEEVVPPVRSQPIQQPTNVNVQQQVSVEPITTESVEQQTQTELDILTNGDPLLFLLGCGGGDLTSCGFLN